MANFDLAMSRDEFDWEPALFGTFDAPKLVDETPGIYTTVTVTDGLNVFTFSGTGLEVDSNGLLIAGTITEILFRNNGNEIFHVTATTVLATDLQALLDNGAADGRDPRFVAVFAAEATTFNGSVAGGETFFGSSGNDEFTLTGTPDSQLNYVYTGGGDDTVHGSAAEDFVDFSANPNGITVDFETGTVTDNVTMLEVGHFDDAVEDIGGTNLNDTMNGDERENRMFGGAGADTLNGGAGNDYFEGGAGSDSIDGGDDWDRLSFAHDNGLAAGVTFNLTGGGAGTVTSGSDTDTFTNIEALQGSQLADTFNGSTDADYFEGLGGEDTMFGGDGNDTLIGGAGIDSLNGGADIDTLDYSNEGGGGAISVDLSAGTVTDSFGNVDNIANIEVVIGTDQQDNFIGGAGEDSFNGGDDDDALYGGDGNNTLNGGNGNGDYVYYGMSDYGVTIDLGAGTVTHGQTGQFTDTLISVEAAHGSNYNDLIIFGNAGTYVFAEAGNDTMIGGDGNDNLIPGSGNDSVDGGNGHDHVDYFDDTSGGPVATHGVIVNFTGSSVDVDTLTGTVTVAANTAFDGWDGIDSIVNVEAASGTSFDDAFFGGDEDNGFYGRGGNDLMIGGNGNNDYDGGDGDDTIIGGDNDDWMRGGRGSDVFRGGNGWNNIVYIDDQGRTTGIVFDWNTGVATGEASEVDHFESWSIGSVHGTMFNDTLIGNAEDNTFHGYGGVDLIIGGGGKDTIHFHGERDQTGGNNHGVTIVLGEDDGDGNDILANEANTAVAGTAYLLGDLVNGSVKGYTDDAFGNRDIIYSIENAEGTDFNDNITGSNERNELRGMRGNDTISGRGGDDKIDGGAGNDSLDGGDGNDWFSGDGGVDVIDGGSGDDGLGFYMWGDDRNNDTVDDNDGDHVEITLTAGYGTGHAAGSIYRDEETRTVDTSFSGLDSAEGTRGNDSITVQAGFKTDGLGWDWRTFGDDRDPAGPFRFSGGRGNDTITDVHYKLVLEYGNESHWENRNDGEAHGVAINLSMTDKVAAGFDAFANDGSDTVIAGTAIDTFGDRDIINGVTLFSMTNYADYFWGRDNPGGPDSGVYVQGNDGNDYLVGGLGDDVLQGDRDNDTLMGGAGIDHLSGDRGADLIYGDDDLDSTGLADGGDHLSGGDDNDTIFGGGGRDNISGDNGQDSLSGGASKDRLWGGQDDDVLDGGDDNDQLEGEDGNDTIEGGKGDDQVRGGNDQDLLSGGKGNDDIEGQDGNDLLYGDDTVGGGSASNVGNDTIRGGQGDDTIFGGYGGDRIEADEGEDIVNGGFGNDSIQGGDDRDNLNGDAGDDRINGDDGKDSLQGGAGNDKLWGDDDNDSLNGGEGSDDLNGGDGVDTLYATNGNDRLYGDNGDDIYELGGFGVSDVWDSSGIDLVKTSISRNLTDYGMGGSIDNATVVGAANGTQVNLIGNGLKNILTGHNGINSLSGGGDNDSLVGLGGADTLDGGAGIDTLVGGDGNDVYFVDVAGDITTEGNTASSGDDLVNFVAASGTYTLTNANVERLTLGGSTNIGGVGNALANTITGNAGNNNINGGTGIDTMIGGNGNDTYTLDVLGDVVDESASTGDDLVIFLGTTGTYTLTTNVERLTLGGSALINGTGNGLANTITGNSAANTINGMAGNDTMIGGDGSDTYTADSANDVVTESNSILATGGDDLVIFSGTSGTFQLGANVERLQLSGSSNINGTGNNLANTMTGNTGANSLVGGDGNDTLLYSNGNDTYVGGNGNDTFSMSSSSGSAGNVTLNVTTQQQYYFTSGNSVTLSGFENLVGSTLGEYLGGNSGANVIDGNSGDDLLFWSGGNDTIIGGAGDDTFELFNVTIVTATGWSGNDLTVGANIDLSKTTAQSYNGATLTFSGVEGLIGGNGNDTLTGSSAANTLLGGRAGNDSLSGLDGNDEFYVIGTGADTYNGGNGTDSFNLYSEYLELGALNLTLNLSLATAQSLGAYGSVVLSSVENIFSSSGADNLTGSSAANYIYSSSGNDTLNGGLGNDTLDGSTGQDFYVFDSALGATNIDTISSFVSADDTIRLKGSVFAAIGPSLTAGEFVVSTTGLAAAADDRIIYESDTGNLYYDADGNGAGARVQFATLSGHPTLALADFAIV